MSDPSTARESVWIGAEQGREGRKRLKRSPEPLTVAKTAKRTDNPAKEITPVRPSSFANSPM
ncbi:MAG: hypothetical protein OSA98_01530 [Rubripirellula sp.]|nr:hypothetical protein [Rubripirellula sp.]